MEEAIAQFVVFFGFSMVNILSTIPAFAVGIWFWDDTGFGILGGTIMGLMIFAWISYVSSDVLGTDADYSNSLVISGFLMSGAGLAFALWAWAGTSFGSLLGKKRRST